MLTLYRFHCACSAHSDTNIIFCKMFLKGYEPRRSLHLSNLLCAWHGCIQDPRRLDPRPAVPSDGVTVLLTPKLEVEVNAVPPPVANAQTGNSNLENTLNVSTNSRDPRAMFHVNANHRSIGQSHIQVKQELKQEPLQEPKQEPIELENRVVSDPSLPSSPPPQSGVSTVPGMITSVLFKFFINDQALSINTNRF